MNVHFHLEKYHFLNNLNHNRSNECIFNFLLFQKKITDQFPIRFGIEVSILKIKQQIAVLEKTQLSLHKGEIVLMKIKRSNVCSMTWIVESGLINIPKWLLRSLLSLMKSRNLQKMCKTWENTHF